MLENTSLFENIVGDDGEYDAHIHLAQIVSLLGDPPETLINGERVYRKLKLGRTIENPRGRSCETINEYWGGPFFDEHGKSSDDMIWLEWLKLISQPFYNRRNHAQRSYGTNTEAGGHCH